MADAQADPSLLGTQVFLLDLLCAGSVMKIFWRGKNLQTIMVLRILVHIEYKEYSS